MWNKKNSRIFEDDWISGKTLCKLQNHQSCLQWKKRWQHSWRGRGRRRWRWRGGGRWWGGGAWQLLFDFSSSFALHQEAASLNNNSQLTGKLIPRSRQTGLVQSRVIREKNIYNKYPLLSKYILSIPMIKKFRCSYFFKVLIWLCAFRFLYNLWKCFLLIYFLAFYCSVWSVCQQPFGPITTHPRPRLKPQSLRSQMSASVMEKNCFFFPFLFLSSSSFFFFC